MIWLALSAVLGTWLLTGAYIRLMNARGRLDMPNERSMHKLPVPSGAGVLAIVVVLVAWVWAAPQISQTLLVVAACGLALSVLGWIDDMRRLGVSVRFGAQAAAILVCLWLLPAEARALPALPLLFERLIEGAAWLWFVNLFNFMDGIDGLAGSEAAAVSLGYVAILGVAAPESPLALLIAAAMLGYLGWNWAPSRVMMGDAGSIPLGFLIGWMMLDLSVRGHLLSALILPLYFCVDATYTLVSRMLKGKLPTQAHREHFYQRAARGCGSHATVVIGVSFANVGFTMMAQLALKHPFVAAAGAGLIAGLLFMWLKHLSSAQESAA